MLKKFLSFFIIFSLIFQTSNLSYLSANANYINPNVFLPSKYGYIVDSFNTSNITENPVILIKDVHCNPFVQNNIYKILVSINNNVKKISHVFLEGSWSELDVNFFKSIPNDEKIKEKISDDLLNKGLLLGPEKYVIMEKENVKLIGVEQEDLYKSNLKFFVEMLSQKRDLDDNGVLDFVKLSLDEDFFHFTKKNKRIKFFYKLKRQFNEANISIIEYVKNLTKDVEDIEKKYPNIYKFINIEKMRNNIPVDSLISGEAFRVESMLSSVLSKEEKNELGLLKRSNMTDYYGYLNTIIKNKNVVVPSSFRELSFYFNYLDKKKSLDMNVFLDELSVLEYDVFFAAAANEYEKNIVFLCFMYEKYLDYINNKLSYNLVSFYKSRNDEFLLKIQDYFISKKIKIDFTNFCKIVDTANNFYDAVDKRNSPILERILKYRKFNIPILITGGYHIDYLTQSLRSRGITYFVINPSLDENEKDISFTSLNNVYTQRLFLQDRTLGLNETIVENIDIAKLMSSQLNVVSMFEASRMPLEEGKRYLAGLLDLYYPDFWANLRAMGIQGIDGLEDIDSSEKLFFVWLTMVKIDLEKLGLNQKEAGKFFIQMGKNLNRASREYDIKVRQGQIKCDIAGKEYQVPVDVFSSRKELEDKVRARLPKDERIMPKSVREDILARLGRLPRNELLDLYFSFNAGAEDTFRFSDDFSDETLSSDFAIGTQVDYENFRKSYELVVSDEITLTPYLDVWEDLVALFVDENIKIYNPSDKVESLGVDKAKIWVENGFVNITFNFIKMLSLYKSRTSEETYKRVLGDLRTYIYFLNILISSNPSLQQKQSIDKFFGEETFERLRQFKGDELKERLSELMPAEFRAFMRDSLYLKEFLKTGESARVLERYSEEPGEPLRRLSIRLDAEEKERGSGNFRDQYVLSDLHGAGDKTFIMVLQILGLDKLVSVQAFLAEIERAVSTSGFDVKKMPKLIKDLRDKHQITIRKLLEEKFKEELKKGRILEDTIAEYYDDVDIFFLGDIGDRGQYALWVCDILKELKEFKLLKYNITGNHDLWMALNLKGWHLPFYRGYNFHDDRIAKVRSRGLFTPDFEKFLLDKGVMFEEPRKAEDPSNKGMYVLKIKDPDQLARIFSSFSGKKLKDKNDSTFNEEFFLSIFRIFGKEEKEEIMRLGKADTRQKQQYWAKKVAELNKRMSAMQKNSPVFKEDFEKLGIDGEALWDDLIAKGYITKDGNVSEEFNKLKNASDMKLDEKFAAKKAEIFAILQQSRYDDKAKKLQELTKSEGFKSRLEAESKKTPNVKKIWNDLRGNYFNTDVNAGFRAVGLMSLSLWEDRHLEFMEIFSEMNDDGSEYYKAWAQLKIELERVLDVVKKMDREATDPAKKSREDILVWRAINAIWRNNYESSEWWAMEWSRHSGWGPSFMGEEKESGTGTAVDESNYLGFTSFTDMGRFSMDNFKLYTITETGDLLTHGPLPIVVDKESPDYVTVVFDYKGVHYSGRNIFIGFDKIEQDMMTANLDTIDGFEKIREAVELVNSWYADATTIFKPEHLDDYRKIGFRNILTSIGIAGRWYQGHNPYFQKLSKKYPIIDDDIVFCDDGISPGYIYCGGYRFKEMSFSLSKFKRTFGRDVTDTLISQNVIAVKKGVEGKDYVVLLRDDVSEITKLLSEKDVKAEEIIAWFKQDKALKIVGFRDSKTVRLETEPVITGEDGGKPVVTGYKTSKYTVTRDRFIDGLQEKVETELAALSIDPLAVFDSLYKIYGDDFLEQKVKLRDGRNISLKEFFEGLSFGTDGFKEEMGKGFNLMVLSVMFDGLARYLIEKGYPMDKYFMIAFDSRGMGYDVCKLAARILGSYGIKTLIPEDGKSAFTLPQIRYFVSQGAISISNTRYFISHGLYIGAVQNVMGDNGIAILTENGNVFSDEECVRLKAQIGAFKGYRQPIQLPSLQENRQVITFKSTDIYSLYCGYLQTFTGISKERLENVVFDVNHGAGADIVASFLSSLGYTDREIESRIINAGRTMDTKCYPNTRYKYTGSDRLYSVKDGMSIIYNESRVIDLSSLTLPQIDELMRGQIVLIDGVELRFGKNIDEANETLKQLINKRRASLYVGDMQDKIEVTAIIDTTKAKIMVILDADGQAFAFIVQGKYIPANKIMAIMVYDFIERMIEDLKKTAGEKAPKKKELLIKRFKEKYKSFLPKEPETPSKSKLLRKASKAFLSSPDMINIKLKVARTISTSHILDKIFEHFNTSEIRDLFEAEGYKLSFEVVETRTGIKDSYDMLESLILFGEANGHIALTQRTGDDALLAVFDLISRIHLDLIGKYTTIEMGIRYRSEFMEFNVRGEEGLKRFGSLLSKEGEDGIRAKFLDTLKRLGLEGNFEVKDEDEHTRLDGYCLRFYDGGNEDWVLFRFSGTENLGRVTVESQSKEKREILEAVSKYLVGAIDAKKLVEICSKANQLEQYSHILLTEKKFDIFGDAFAIALTKIIDIVKARKITPENLVVNMEAAESMLKSA